MLSTHVFASLTLNTLLLEVVILNLPDRLVPLIFNVMVLPTVTLWLVTVTSYEAANAGLIYDIKQRKLNNKYFFY